MVEHDGHERTDVGSQWRNRAGHSSGSRVAVDRQGRAWTVREMDAARVPGARARRSLIFDTAGHCFRIWQYPVDWRDLTTHELLALGGIGRDD
jgi:hypothetical protein